ncbi:hypothetical protein OCGS_2099 [Oceaniovalibus guishaninsula JLT2003]|uniref:Uncharacterized protein n=1 Tax=Oceaniovalibus guishaninsula JLT2003 TaxID=1231392 RepID=K2I4G0_9RHOB|nr:hypothetical protein OCGS_2099 [Oceaniovalibus guishaninsula JLT2003]
MRREVSAQLARGVAQGLVELDPERPMDDRGSAPDPAPGHVSITTAADRDRTMAPENAEVACIGPEALDVASWKPEGWPDRWIGGSFAALTDAADRPDPNALKTRVRHLLFLGFGAEAAQMLHAAEASAVIVPDAGVMAEMAALTDGPADAPLLSGQAACAGPGIVWALLADGRSFPRTAGVEGLLTEFSRLPSHLRTNLGPRLVAELIALQMPNIAAEVDAAVKRGNPPADAKTAMMTARIATEDGRPEDARESAQAVIKARSPDAVEAMRLMLEQAERYPDLVSPDLPDQALALAFEAESPEREELTLATIRLMAGKGDIAGGFGELLRLRDATDETDIQDADVVTRLHGALNDTPSDDGFVRLAAQSVRDWPPVDDEELRVARAKRLTDLGLHRIARSVLSGFDAPPGRAERLILARIQLNDDDPDLAESYLAGLEGPDVVSLKALIEEARAAQQAIAAEPLPVDVQNPATARRELLDGSRAIRAEVEALLGQR